MKIPDEFVREQQKLMHHRPHLQQMFQRHCIWAATWQKPTKWLCAQRRLRSAWASAQSDQSLCCALNAYPFFMQTAKTLIRLGGCPGWSESSLGAHSFCWFCHVAAHIRSNREQDHWSELRYNLHCDNSELTLGLKTHECSSPNRLLQLAVEPMSTTRNVFVLSVDLNRPRAECLHDRKIHFKVYRCTIEISVGYRIFWARPIAKTWG